MKDADNNSGMKKRFDNKTGSLIAGIAIFSIVVIQSSCYYSRSSPGWEYMPDMVHSIAYETYAVNPNFPDSSNALRPVTGTIPRGAYMPFHYSPNPSGYDSAGAMLHFPTWLTETDRAEGKRLFQIYCAVCHGLSGKGDGTIVSNTSLKNPFPPPPSYFDDLHLNLPEGKEYYSVHYGKNLMGPYSKVLDHDQLWKVVYYVKSLQIRYKDSVAALPPPPAATASATTDTSKKK